VNVKIIALNVSNYGLENGTPERLSYIWLELLLRTNTVFQR